MWKRDHLHGERFKFFIALYARPHAKMYSQQFEGNMNERSGSILERKKLHGHLKI